MANADGKTAARRGLTVMDCFWGAIYTGTKDELIATGHFKDEWFSQEVKPGRCCFKETIDGREMKIVRRSKLIFYGYRNLTDLEQTQHDSLESQRKAVDNFNRALACLPKSGQEFKDHFAAHERINANIFLEFAGPEGRFRGGYSFDPESLTDIEDAFDALIAAIQNARVFYSTEDRERCIGALRRTYAAEVADPQASRFLSQLKSLPPAEE
jgi:hypothetical protein